MMIDVFTDEIVLYISDKRRVDAPQFNELVWSLDLLLIFVF